MTPIAIRSLLATMASKDVIALAAPMQADDGASVTGTFFLIDVASRADAEKFTQGDAFVQHGVFQSVTITSLKQGLWNPAAVRA